MDTTPQAPHADMSSRDTISALLENGRKRKLSLTNAETGRGSLSDAVNFGDNTSLPAAHAKDLEHTILNEREASSNTLVEGGSGKRAKLIDSAETGQTGDADKELKHLRMELLSAKNACLKAKLDCEQTRCHLYEKDKIISDLTEEISRLKAQLDTETQNHKTELLNLQEELIHQKAERAKEQRQIAQLVQLLNQIEQESPKQRLKSDKMSDALSTYRSQAVEQQNCDISTKKSHSPLPNQSTIAADRRPTPVDRRSLENEPDTNNNHHRKTGPITRPEMDEQCDEDPNASAIIPVDEEKLREVEEQKKIEAMLRVEIPAEALAEVTKQPGIREDFPVDTTDMKSNVQPQVDKRRMENKWMPTPQAQAERIPLAAPPHLPSRMPAQFPAESVARQQYVTQPMMSRFAPIPHPDPAAYYGGMDQYGRIRTPPSDALSANRLSAGPHYETRRSPASIPGPGGPGLYSNARARTESLQARSPPLDGSLSLRGTSREQAGRVGDVAMESMNTSSRGSVAASPYISKMTAEKQTSPGHASQELPAIVPVKQEPDALPSSSEGTPFDAPKVRNDVTIHKAQSGLHLYDPTRRVEWKECEQGTVAVKAVPGRPETARLVMYDDWTDKRVINLNLSSEVSIKLDDSDIVVTQNPSQSIHYVIKLGSRQAAVDFFNAIRNTTSPVDKELRSPPGLSDFLKSYRMSSSGLDGSVATSAEGGVPPLPSGAARRDAVEFLNRASGVYH